MITRVIIFGKQFMDTQYVMTPRHLVRKKKKKKYKLYDMIGWERKKQMKGVDKVFKKNRCLYIIIQHI